MSNTRLRSLVALVLAAGTSVAVAVPAEPAHATIGAVRPSIQIQPKPGQPVLCHVTVGGYVSMTRDEANRLLADGHKVVVRVWGEDPFDDDDLLIGPRQAGVAPADRGLNFLFGVTVNRSDLNEDLFTEVAPGDEVYAGVRLINKFGETIRKAETFRRTAQGNGNFYERCDSTVLN